MALKYSNKLNGKLILVIGGTSGIGFAVAEASVEFGARVVVASRSQDRVNEAVNKLNANYPDASDRIRGHVVDLGGDNVEASVTKLFEFVTSSHEETINHLVETAGEYLNGLLRLQEVTLAEIREMSRTRVEGSVILAKVASKYLKQEYTSSFTLTGAKTAYKPARGAGLRAGTPGAKEALARGLAVEMHPVRVNLVSPGAVHTELLHESTKDFGPDPEVIGKLLADMSLMGRVGDPEDLAESYLSLMRNHFVTREVLRVDGGVLLK